MSVLSHAHLELVHAREMRDNKRCAVAPNSQPDRVDCARAQTRHFRSSRADFRHDNLGCSMKPAVVQESGA